MKIYDKEVENTKRIFYLDFLRASAIILVVISHMTGLLFPQKFRYFIANTFGILGVEMFFVLSGFLIGTIIIKTFNEQDEFGFKKIRGFWIRRWFRTLPNYYLILLISLIAYYITHGIFLLKDANYLAYFAFLQSSITSHPNFFGVAWSLAIEEGFYLLFPILLLIVSKLKLRKSGALVIAAGTIILISGMLRVFLALTYPELPWHSIFYKIMPLRLDSIAMGVLTAIVYYYRKDFLERHKVKLFAAGLILLLNGGLSFSLYFALANGISDSANIVVRTIFFNLIELSIALLFPMLVSMKRLGHEGTAKFITHISIISYSVYLIHLPIIVLITNTPVDSIFKIVFILIILFAVSTLQYRFFEKPITLVREKFSRKIPVN